MSRLKRRYSKRRPDVVSPEPDKDQATSALDWILRYAVPLVGVIGAALYGVLRLAYLFFYLRLRASPDEVGYGYTQVLADELVGAIELVILTALCLMLAGTVGMISIQLLRRINSNSNSLGSVNWGMRFRKLVVWCLAIAIPVVLVGLPVLAWLEGEEAAKGFTVRNVYISHLILLPVLAVEAVPAKVAWLTTNGPDAAAVSTRECLLYLGQANGVSVFYDVQSEESIRLASADVVVTLQNITSVPIGC